ncbi:MAG: hypothetical protein BWX88_04125 [Planctomycetes bacterium ADurb.Bin126]|nr:MAG: hypothetical protein BWX88_04125 [Planctomycetes bacterium ADurb.Bin126]HOD82833.1 sialate O-acetylesterase [Phycisphaerae bacterium]HQL74646.1 sialate O-acetylesterase [Phycisphaerae bacterium]
MIRTHCARLTVVLVALAALACQAAAKDPRPLKVFLLVGQSNMQGHAAVSTFEPIGLDPKTAPMLKDILDDAGKPRVCQDVWISSIGSSKEEKTGRLTVGFGAGETKIGPEFTFGLYAHKLLGEPILIIKTAWGGKSLNTDFRPPGAGPYQFNEKQLETFAKQKKDIEALKAERAKASGAYYRLMMDYVKKVLADIKQVYPDYDPKQGYELAGFVWFQGWNDMVDGGTYAQRGQPGGYDQYGKLLAQFIRDVRKDLSAPKLPFVIGVMGAGGPVSAYSPDKQRYASIHQSFREAMAAPAAMDEFKGNVAAVWTEKFWDLELDKLLLKDRQIQQELKKLQQDKKLTRDQAKQALEERRAKAFSPRELTVLTKSVSNFEFHYLGSAKVMTQIGRAFAEAAVKMIQERN